MISNLFSGHIEALGGERALRRIKSRLVKGTLELEDTKAEFETHQSKDGRFLDVRHLPGRTIQTGYDGETVWTQAGDESWEALSEDDAISTRFFSSLTGILDWATFYTSSELLPDTEINGRPAKVVAVNTSSGEQRKIFFDAQKHRIVRIDEDAELGDSGLVPVERYLKDYRAVDDVVMPYLEETVFPTTVSKKTVWSVEQNVDLDENLFSPPKVGEVAKSGVRDTERHFDRLTVGGIVYTNVWVHRQTNYNVLIRHSQGIHTIRLTDLPQEDLDELRPQIGDLANIEDDNNVVTEKWDELAGDAELQAVFRERAETIANMMKLVMIPFIIGWVVGHLIWSYVIKRLCEKTETKGGLAVWIPFVQMAPMFRAAGFSDKWIGAVIALVGFPTLLFAIAPMIGFDIGSAASMVGVALMAVGWLVFAIASIIWPFRICGRCQKSPFLGLLMFLPVVNVGLILYLAFSKEE